MTKIKAQNTPPAIGNTQQLGTYKTTISELKDQKHIWYKLDVLIYDLSNIKHDPASVARLERTVDELYISEPYFTSSEASLVKNTLVEGSHQNDKTEDLEDIIAQGTIAEPQETRMKDGTLNLGGFETVEAAITLRMSTIYDKRKASGDFRPCGPHDMVPVYSKVFNIDKRELEDERLIERLRRSGITEAKESSKEVRSSTMEGRKKWKKGKKAKKGE